MAKTGTSYTVLDNPQLFESSIQSLIRLTKNGLLVWRVSRHNQKRVEAFPSRSECGKGSVASMPLYG